MRPDALDGPGWEQLTFEDMFASVKRVSDILPVEGHTGQDAYDLTMKQLTAFGCPHWDSDGSFFGKGP